MADVAASALSAVALVAADCLLFLVWAAAGNAVAGKRADFLHPLATTRQIPPVTARAEQLLSFYLMAYIPLAVIVSVTQWGRVQRAVRSALGRLRPAPRAPAPGVAPVASSSSTHLETALASTPSTTSVTPKTSRKLLSRSRSRRRPSRRSLTPPEQKVEYPSVLRSSVVAPHNQIIPPLPRMSRSEEPDEKLARLMKKFDSLDSPSQDLDQSRSEESLAKRRKKA